ncbi:MAG: PAS domain S-box protein [Deltaproteobacteria bacterium]|nr:PAS domain S-box protein [Deltaproteobacteria bacterium]
MNFNLINITEKMLSGKDLKEHEHYLKTILDSVQAGIIIVDLKTRKIVEANPAAIKMMGEPKEKVLGSLCHKYACMTEANQCPVIDSDQHIDNSERILQKANGERLNIIKTTTKIMIQGKEHLLESFIDITEKKKLEAQLRHSQKMEAVGTLAGGIAHDFNNILQIISGSVQLMLVEKSPDDPDCNALEIIEKSVQRACDLTKQLLIYGKQVETKFRTVDLNQELLNVSNLLERTILKTIHIELDLPENIKTIEADPSQLEQIILNLAINAKDAMPDGGELVFQTGNKTIDKEFCKAHPGANTGEYVLLSVSDSGLGMDKEILEHIFEPFYTTKEMEKGTGLGLAMVYSIVKSHGGYIICDSMPGYGTTFKIYFPVAVPC